MVPVLVPPPVVLNTTACPPTARLLPAASFAWSVMVAVDPDVTVPLETETVEASSGNDQVKVTVNGGGELVSITIAPELLKQEDLGMVQDLIVAGTNAALKKSHEMVEAEIEKVTGGVKIPGLV